MSDATTWTSLLLDKQRMQAAADEAAERMKYTQMRDMLNTGLSAASTIKGAMDEAKLDDIANSLMNANENIPRAQAVDPSKQAAADAKAARMPGFHTGGVAEMKLDAMMQNQKLQGIREKLLRGQAGSLGGSQNGYLTLQESQEQRNADMAKAVAKLGMQQAAPPPFGGDALSNVSNTPALGVSGSLTNSLRPEQIILQGNQMFLVNSQGIPVRIS